MKAVWVAVLFVALVIYTILGGVIFSYVERGNEQTVVAEVELALNEFLNNTPCLTRGNLTAFLTVFVRAYDAGFISGPSATPPDEEIWSLSSSFFFAMTIITTIGYGHISPSTSGGRVFFVFFAIFGIPLTLVFLAQIGVGLSKINRKISDKVRCSKSEKFNSVCSTLLLSILGVLFFLFLPAGMFAIQEGWTYEEALYYGVVTLTTVGFGDFVAAADVEDNARSKFYRLSVMLWIFLGLAWLAGIIADIQESMAGRMDKKGEKISDDPDPGSKSSSVSLGGNSKTEKSPDGTSVNNDVTLTRYSSAENLKEP